MSQCFPVSTINPGVESVVHYRFMPAVTGLVMELWEPSPRAKMGAPYQFRWQHRFATEKEALSALREYVEVNAIARAIADHQHPPSLNALETVVIARQ